MLKFLNVTSDNM